ncbi:MAG: hypothetical protein ACOCY0_04900, partial [Roseicyclus sp.]
MSDPGEAVSGAEAVVGEAAEACVGGRAMVRRGLGVRRQGRCGNRRARVRQHGEDAEIAEPVPSARDGRGERQGGLRLAIDRGLGTRAGGEERLPVAPLESAERLQRALGAIGPAARDAAARRVAPARAVVRAEAVRDEDGREEDIAADRRGWQWRHGSVPRVERRLKVPS